MQLYLWPPNVPALLSGRNRLYSLPPAYACERVNIPGVHFNSYCTRTPVFLADYSWSNFWFSFFPCFCLIFPQNQAEAHYKGHKHARKLKAMEAQKNRQRRAGESSSTGRERDRDRDRERERDISKTSTSEAALPTLMDTCLEEGTSRYSGRKMGQRHLQECAICNRSFSNPLHLLDITLSLFDSSNSSSAPLHLSKPHQPICFSHYWQFPSSSISWPPLSLSLSSSVLHFEIISSVHLIPHPLGLLSPL